jgi:hypothetical protein
MEYKIGQIIFFNWNGFYSKAVGAYNLKKYKEIGWTHVGIITQVDKDMVVIHEALGKGFISSYYEKWWLDDKIKNKIILIKEVREPLNDVFDNAEKYRDIKYGWRDIFGIIFRYVFGFELFPMSGPNRLICSEAVVRILYDSSDKKIDFEKEYAIPFDFITPMDIYLSKFLKEVK